MSKEDSYKVLILGANGFLGRTVVRKCKDKGWDVHEVTRKANIETSTMEYQEVVRNRYNFIINAAAFVPYGSFNIPNESLIDSNLALPLKLHKDFRDTRIVYASSVAVYGDTHETITEASKISEPSYYGLSKLSGEFITKHHSSYSVLRFSSLYGEGMNPSTFLPKIISSALNNKVIQLYGDGSRLQNYLHVEDAADYCLNAALLAKNDTYLAVGDKSYSNLEVASILSAKTGCEVKYQGEDNSHSYVYDNSYTLQELGFIPRISLSEGLGRLL